MTRRLPTALLCCVLFLATEWVKAQSFSFTSPEGVSILYDAKGPKLDAIAAQLLADDIESVTGRHPRVVTSITGVQGNCVVIGNLSSELIRHFLNNQSPMVEKLRNQWECFAWKIVDHPLPAITRAFVIAGSDTRGTAYGVFSLSEKLGVSPWYWWADAPVKQQKELVIEQTDSVSAPPSVRYRGLFINDEDWGLQPWAAKTFEPETGDIGPKTYARVFELLLRLKANLIWPAMHPSTRAFYHYPLNPKVAADYAIIIGSSHAEPMLRNNVGEWNTATMGHFNYVTNKDRVYEYWENRIRETGTQEAVFTIGMRGIHDGKMEGVKNAKEAVPILQKVIEDQRGLLQKYQHKAINTIPQVFTAYKEVLDIYDNGLQLPDDITIVWPEDNYGYIQRLNNQKERVRSGGSGVYYHVSYWGRPHDYLWLSTAHPSLIREEMYKAYETGSNRLWMLNVGDIKPAEYDIQLFMDMAYHIDSFKEGGAVTQHLQGWMTRLFGQEKARKITPVMWDYYQLAFERRPEFMGWSQTEPTTPTSYTAYNHFSYGDEAQQRIHHYDSLEMQVQALQKEMAPEERDAFYQLVYYPVVGASLMNKKFLYRDKAYLYARQNRICARYCARESEMAYEQMIRETDFFNHQLSGGKWNGIMSMKPRDLPVFRMPQLPSLPVARQKIWDVAPEGYDPLAYDNQLPKQLPVFTSGLRQSYFVDIFLCDSVQTEWRAVPSASWIRLSATNGSLVPDQDKSSYRFGVSIDWPKVPPGEKLNAFVTIEAAGNKQSIGIVVLQPDFPGFKDHNGVVEANGVVSMFATHYSHKYDKAEINWKTVEGLGHTGASVQASLSLTPLKNAIDTMIRKHSAYLEYSFYSLSADTARLLSYTLPTHPVNDNFSMRYGISIDDMPVHLVDIKTYGRSEEWKQHVLQNVAIRSVSLPVLSPGKHVLKIYAIDPGVILDRFLIKFGDKPDNYGVIPETWKSNVK